MRFFTKILSKIIPVAVAIFLTAPCVAASANLPMADIGDHGSWATEANHKLFTSKLSHDVEAFVGPKAPVALDSYVPVEAKVGLMFMNAFSFIGHVLDTSLVRFVIIFIILAYCMWIMLEAYTIITGKSDAKSKVIEILKKGGIVFIWIAILQIGPAKTFMMVMSPILQVGTFISDVILNAVTEAAGITIPDTCSAIRDYAAANISKTNLLDPQAAADIMCIPTRLSGFCYSAMVIGKNWMLLGIGRSMFSFLCGGAFVAGFLYLAWRFAFIAFGVIADLFLGIIMLPFTAIAETIGKTSYKGIVGDIFNGFMGLFKAESIQAQIARFLNAALHFVALSIVISVCAALLSNIVTINSADAIPQIDTPGLWVTILILALTIWLAKNGSKIATELGGSIDASFGGKLQSDATLLWNDTKNTAKKWWKIIKEGSKK